MSIFKQTVLEMKEILPESFHHVVDQLQPTLIASSPVRISAQAARKIREFIEITEDVFEQSPFLSSLRSTNEIQSFDPGYESLFTSYDFHITGDQVKLIEINTNASMSPLFHLLNKTQNITSHNDYLENIKDMFDQVAQSKELLIMDQKPAQQPMFFEFLLMQSWLKSFGYECEIIDSKDVDHFLNQNSGSYLIYNRDTDFYFDQPAFTKLKELYLLNEVRVSPHPRGYYLRADKDRLQNLRSYADQSTLDLKSQSIFRDIIPESFEVQPDAASDLWKNRAAYFFKPKNSYGSKAVYKGKTMSKKVFEHILSEPYIAQQICPPGECIQSTPSGDENFKFDVRVYTYGAKIFMMGARVYQGQVTNFRTLGGGAAPLIVNTF